MINALVVSGGSFQGSTLIKGLKHSSKIRIHLADCFQDNINKYECDVFHWIPPTNQEDDFLNSILHIVKTEKINIIFPSTDHELTLLSRHKDSIETNKAKIAVSDYRIVDILSHKIKTYHFLKKHGFPLLDTIDPESVNISYPIIGKPSHGFGGKGIIILHTKNDYRRVHPSIHLNDYLWTPLIENFQEYSIDFAIAFDGTISPIVARKRTRTAGGFAVITQSKKIQAIEQLIVSLADVIRKKGGCGIFNVQVLRYGDNLLHVSDINPRVGTSSIFTLGSGINLPLFMCSSFMDRPHDYRNKSNATTDIKMVRNLCEKWLPILPEGEVQGIVFDLDDTLIDQKTWIFDKLSIMYNEHARFLPDKATFIFTAHQLVEEGKRAYLIDELKNKFNLSDGLRKKLIQSYRRAQPESIQVYGDVENNLRKLKRIGIKLGLLTDNPVKSQEQKINMINFINIFDARLLSLEYDREKPDAFLFNKISEDLGVNVEQLAMVGDNLYRDCYGAINAGYHSAFFIERKGAFFNFNFQYFLNALKPNTDKISKISSLNELYYAFECSE